MLNELANRRLKRVVDGIGGSFQKSKLFSAVFSPAERLANVAELLIGGHCIDFTGRRALVCASWTSGSIR